MSLHQIRSNHILFLLRSILSNNSPVCLAENLNFILDISEWRIRGGTALLPIQIHRSNF